MDTLGIICIVASLATLSVSAFVAWLAAGWTGNRGLRAFAGFLFCLIGMGLTAFIPGAITEAGTMESKLISYVFESVCLLLLPSLAFGIIGKKTPRRFAVIYAAGCAILVAVKIVVCLFYLSQTAQTLIAAVDTAIAVGFFAFMVASRRQIADELTRRVVFRFTLIACAFTPLLFYNCIGVPGFRRFLNAYLTEGLFFFAVSLIVIAESKTWLASLAARIHIYPKTQESPGPGSTENGAATGRIYSGLSERQREIADMILSGDSAKDIASKLAISPKTAENHTYALYRKFGARSRIQFYEMMRDAKRD